MRILVEMEIESPDYGGKEFKKEIEKLLEDIRVCSGDLPGAIKLFKFKMCKKDGAWDLKKDIDWRK